ncbi:uncharacterized protein LOC124350805 isoform X2 [Daphnia pulicaria]|uniref:uncharacterized protein LOC124350805 isoform X2 n=1 Tax=Daphnia pulicaria TaxID=35523 RepID=UPI001EEC3A13|nr:uncharacterized protein LOC124350805 isoform X2 [Daphnia pulicaria]
MQFSISKMSIVSLLFFIGLQVNQSIAVPVFRDAASMAFAIQHQPELFRLQAAQPTGLRAESTLLVPSVNSNFLLNLQYLSGLLNSLSSLLGQSPAHLHPLLTHLHPHPLPDHQITRPRHPLQEQRIVAARCDRFPRSSSRPARLGKLYPYITTPTVSLSLVLTNYR